MEIVVIIGLVLLNGVFSMSEIALVSAKKYRLEQAAKKGSKNALRALGLVNNPGRFFSTVQMGITLIAILTGVFSSDELQTQLQAKLATIPMLAGNAHAFAVVIIVTVVTFITIVFGELIPKRIGLLFPEKIASFMAGPMNVLSIITAPFIWLLTRTNDLVLFLFGIKPDTENRVSEEEIKSIIQHSAEGGEVQEIERRIVERVFSLGDRRISELMTHRTKIVWLDIKDDTEALRKKISSEIHSIYPVSDGSLDNLKGIVSIKDIFAHETDLHNFLVTKHLKKPLVLHDNVPAYKALEAFRNAKLHYAIVVDEYGSIEGIVSMDDVLDALVGDVSEIGQEEYQVTERADGTWLADAQYPYFELLHYFKISDDMPQSEFNTIGGMILDKLSRMPNVGDIIKWQGYEFEIVDMDGMRIDKVLIKRVEEEDDE
jgi:putative hemolysin